MLLAVFAPYVEISDVKFYGKSNGVNLNARDHFQIPQDNQYHRPIEILNFDIEESLCQLS